MVLAIGLVVDDAIVVLENVERIMANEHLAPLEATAMGMQEVTPAVIGIVLSLCSVFIPVAFMGGLAGEMYRQFAITISISVVLSGIVVLTLTPSLCSLLLKQHAPGYQRPKPFVWFNFAFGKLTRLYLRMVRWIKNHGFASACMVCVMLAAIWQLFRILPGGLVPNEEQGYIIGLAVLDDGASLNRTQKISAFNSETVRQNPVVEDCTVINGLDITTSAVKSNYATFFTAILILLCIIKNLEDN